MKSSVCRTIKTLVFMCFSLPQTLLGFTVIQYNSRRATLTLRILQMCKINYIVTLIIVNICSELKPCWTLFVSTLHEFTHLILTVTQLDVYHLFPYLQKWE